MRQPLKKELLQDPISVWFAYYVINNYLLTIAITRCYINFACQKLYNVIALMLNVNNYTYGRV